MKKFHCLSLLLLAASFAATFTGCRATTPQSQTAAPVAADASAIRNFLRVNESFCTGGQPSLEQLVALKYDGVKAIINLRPPSEHDAAAEAAKAKELGLEYFTIPVVASNPQAAQADEFLKLTDDPTKRPAFVHCAGAVRVGAFWLIRRVLRDGWTFEKATEEAEKIGLRGNVTLLEFARKYINEHPTKS